MKYKWAKKNLTNDSSSFVVCVVLNQFREMVEIWQIVDMGKYSFWALELNMKSSWGFSSIDQAFLWDVISEKL